MNVKNIYSAQKIIPLMQFILIFLSLTKSSNIPTSNSRIGELDYHLDRRMVEFKGISFGKSSVNENPVVNRAELCSTHVDSSCKNMAEKNLEKAIEKMRKINNIDMIFNIIKELFSDENEKVKNTYILGNERKILIDRFFAALYQHKKLVNENYSFLPIPILQAWIESNEDLV